MEELWTAQSISQDFLLDTIKLATEIEERLVLWPSSLPSIWRPIRVTGLDDDRKLFAQDPETYASLDIAHNWNLYRCLRIMIRISISTCCLRTGSLPPPIDSNRICQDMVDGICATFPYQVGRLKYIHEPSTMCNMEALADNNFEQKSTCPDENRIVTALGTMYIMPRFRYVLAQKLILRQGQAEWIQRQIDDRDRFYRADNLTCS